MFEAIGRFVVKNRWWVILTWVVGAIALVMLAPKFEVSSEQTDFLPKHYDSVRAFEVQAKAFPQAKGQTAIIVGTRKDGQALTAADQQKLTGLAKTLSDKQIKGISGVTAGPVAPNKLVQMLMVRFTSQSFNDPEVTESVHTLRDEIKKTDTGLETLVTGDAAIGADSQESYEKSDAKVLMATIVLIIILLFLTFRGIISAIIPILTFVVMMMVAFSLIGLVNKIFGLKADFMTQSLMPIVLLGVGTDYILFLLFRYRERLRLGENKDLAMVNSVHKVGEVIASAALAVIIAFSALILASLGMLKSMGPAISIGIAVTLLAGLTLIPAVVSLLGRRVFWPSKSWQKVPEHKISGRIGAAIGQRPGVIALTAAMVLVALTVIAVNYKPNFDMGSAPKETEAARGLVAMSKGFPPGAQQVTQLYVTGNEALTGASVQEVAAKAKAVNGIGAVGEPTFSADKKTALFEVQLGTNPLSEQAMNTIEPLRNAVKAAAPPGTEALIGGQTAIMTDLQSAMNRDYRVVFPVAGLLIAIVLGFLLRSVVAPVYLMIAVVLTFLGTIGAAVLYFQHVKGHSGVIFFLPIIVYLFVVALGTDYNILMIARLREEARAGHPPRVGVIEAFKHAAPTVASAGLILAGSFAMFLLASNDAMQEMGTAVAMGVLLAAFVMALFLVPALTVLLGHAAWWPGHQDRADKQAPLIESKLDGVRAEERARKDV